MNVRVIEVPYHAGDERAGASEGPPRLREGGADAVLAAHGIRVAVELVELAEPFRDTAVSSRQVNAHLADAVRRAVGAGELPIVLAGSCNSALGVVAGLEGLPCGAVWLDAHGDFNTPESTASGFFPGMSAAIVTGHCYRRYWAEIGGRTPLDEACIAMFGVRDLAPESERERLESSRITVVRWRDGEPQGDVEAALDQIHRRVEDVYLHVDFDAFAPDEAPGVADEPVVGGLRLDQAETIVRETGRRFRIRAATFATYTPARDEDEKTLRLGLRLLDLLGRYAAGVGTDPRRLGG